MLQVEQEREEALRRAASLEQSLRRTLEDREAAENSLRRIQQLPEITEVLRMRTRSESPGKCHSLTANG